MTRSPDAETILRSALQLFTRAELSRRLEVTEKTVRRWERRETRIPNHWAASIGNLMREWTASGRGGSGSFTFIDLFAGIGGIRI